MSFTAAARFGNELRLSELAEVFVVGVFGGTFDPIHVGHLRTAYELRVQLGLSRVLMVLSGDPPHRAPPVAPAEERWRMLELALGEVPGAGLVADRRELDRPGPSYMVDTLTELRAEVGTTPLCLLLGQDAFAGVGGWHRASQLPALAHLVVATRPGGFAVQDDAVAALWNRRTGEPARLQRAPAGELLALTLTQLDVSASRIRRQLRTGLGADFLTPAPVARHIRERRLYQ